MKISIITPSYHSGKYIERAIQSVLSQDYNNWEHIVVDGGSTDGTLEILKKYPHLKWVSEPDNGQSDAMNKGFNISTGDLIVYLNADDVFSPKVFKDVVSSFKENNCDFVLGNLILKKPEISTEYQPETSYWKILLHFKYVFPLNPLCYFYKRTVQEVIGGFNIDNHYTMDYEFLLEVFRKFKIHKLNKVFGTFFLHEKTKTNNVDAIALCANTALSHCNRRSYLIVLYYKLNRWFYENESIKIGNISSLKLLMLKVYQKARSFILK